MKMTKGRYGNNGKIKNNLETIIDDDYVVDKEKKVNTPIKPSNNYNNFVNSQDYLVDFPNAKYRDEKIYNLELMALLNMPVPIKDYKKSYDNAITGKQAVINLENGHVKNLNIDEYSIGTLPDSLKNLTGLATLLIGEKENCNTKFILPSIMDKLKNLKKIIINYADFSYIPAELKELKNLTNISFSNTNINDITVLYSIPSLKQIDLSDSKVEKISGEILKLNNLELLKISDLNLDNNSKMIVELLKKKGVRIIN